MKKSGTMRKIMALILSVVVVITMMPQIVSPSKVSADETANSQPNYLTFTAAEDDSSITFKWADGTNVQMKTNTDTEWSDYTAGTKIELSNIGDSVSFRGRNVITTYYNHFAMTGKIKASGSVTSLTDENGNDPDVKLSASRYCDMFYECTSLETAPELPATTLAEDCYYSMFYGCTSLETAPELPATTLAESCYYSMFCGCTSLETAPELPAKELASQCYESMFEKCTSLKTAPQLPATSLAWRCYAYMFYDCSALNISTIINEAHSLPWVIANTGTGSGINSEIYRMFTGAWNVDFGNGYGQSSPKAGTVYYTRCNHEYGSDNKCKICGWEKPATEINTVDVTVSAPTPSESFNTSATCSTTGVASASAITWTKADGTVVSENEKTQYGTVYYANITLTAADGYAFTNTTAVKCNSEAYDGTEVTLNDNGTLTVKIPFTTAKAKLLGITKPQQNITVGFGAAKTVDGLKLPKTAAVETELSDVTSADIEWNLDDVKYDNTKYEEQKFDVTGIIVLPETIDANGMDLSVKLSVTVSAAKKISYTATGYTGTYDGKTHGITVKVTDPADATVTYSLTGAIGTKNEFKDAGTYKLYYYINKEGYEPVVGTCDVVINPKELTAAISAKSKEYDRTVAAAVSATVDTGITGEKLSIAGITGAFDNANAGNNKNVSIDSQKASVAVDTTSASGTKVENYTIKYPKITTASINARKLIFSWPDESSFTYDENEHYVNAAITNIVQGDTVNITYSNEGSEVNRAVESGQYTAKITGLDNTNYTLDGSNNTYQWAINEFETDARATVSGVEGKNGWFKSGIVTLKAPDGYKVRVSTDKSDWQDVAEFSFADGADRSTSYSLKQVSTGYVKNAISSTLVNIDSKAPTGTISVKKNNITSLLNTITFKHFFKNTVDITFEATDTTSGVAKIEYALLSGDQDVSEASWNDITETKKISVTANSKKVIYARLTDNAGNSSIINTDGIVVYTDAVTTGKDVAFERLKVADITTDITVNGNMVSTVEIDGKAVSNDLADVITVNEDGKIVLKKTFLETLSAGDHSLTISYNPLGEEYVSDSKNEAPAKSVIVIHVNRQQGTISDISDIGKTYDGKAVSVPDFTTSNTKNEKTVTYEYKQQNAADTEYTTAVPVNAGRYTIRITVAADDNYSVAVSTKDFTIAKKLVNIRWTDDEFIYDGTAHMANANVVSSEIEGKDNVGVVITGAQTNAGKYTATATGVDNANYELSTKADRTHDFFIAKKQVRVTADSIEKHVNAADPEFTYTVEENALIAGDKLNGITLERTRGEDCGKYGIIVKVNASANPNYDITTIPGTLTIANHTYADTTYTWSDDNTKCTAARKCTFCGKTDTETAESKAEVTQEKTCTLPELTRYTVAFKNANGTDFADQIKENVQTAEATGHKWNNGVQSKAPTYTEEGEMLYTCEVCGDTKTEVIEKLKLNEYDILEGADGTHVLKEDGSYSVRVNCAIEYFVAVQLDGKTVDSAYYTVESGSTIVTFIKEFMDSLSIGDHEVKFIFTNGTAKAAIKVVEKTQDTKQDTVDKPSASTGTKTPATQQKKAAKSGDENPARWVLFLMMFGGAGAATYGMKRKKIR